jgi:hypothetical protein
MKTSHLLAAGAFAVVCLCAQNQPPASKSGTPRDLGTPAQAITPSAAQSRRDNDLNVPSGQVSVRGILIDAGCSERDAANLRLPPETLQEEAPAQPSTAPANNPPANGAVNAKGISIDASTVQTERAGVMESHVPGMFERQSDPTCAITGSTTSFAVFTDNGRLLDLDQGGNTLALVAVEATSGGRAMLNGKGPGVKPRVMVKGQFRGDRLITQDVTAIH